MVGRLDSADVACRRRLQGNTLQHLLLSVIPLSLRAVVPRVIQVLAIGLVSTPLGDVLSAVEHVLDLLNPFLVLDLSLLDLVHLVLVFLF